MRRVLFVALSVLVAAASRAAAQAKPRQELKEVTPEKVDTAVYQRLKYRYIGPEGNRVTSVTGVAGDPNTYYAGAASGGLWKSTDGGIHWSPVFDSQPVSSVGALAVAPSDPNVVYAGTGGPFTRRHILLVRTHYLEANLIGELFLFCVGDRLSSCGPCDS